MIRFVLLFYGQKERGERSLSETRDKEDKERVTTEAGTLGHVLNQVKPTMQGRS